jgi:type III secretion protein R
MSFLQTTPNPVDLLLIIVALAMLPFVMVMVTCYTKIIVVFMILRNAFALQNVPPTFALNGLTIVLTLFIMAPVLQKSYETVRDLDPPRDARELLDQLRPAAEPFAKFLLAHSKPSDRQFYAQAAREIWKGSDLAPPGDDSPFVLIPAFVTGELVRAFGSGFPVFLPFLVIDLVVAASLSAMGMQMVQPTTISLPLKITLFVQTEGWRLLLNGLILSYT